METQPGFPHTNACGLKFFFNEFWNKFLTFAPYMRKILILLSVALITLFSACSHYESVLKSKDINYKLTKANEYYDQQKWTKANQVYESLMPALRGTKNYEELYYRYCYTFYNMEDYLSASYQFKNFVEAFPKSVNADECEFMYATCLYKMSPNFELDQTSTRKAIEVLQSYINTHPNSKNITLANKYIDICRAKIETKGSHAAQLYYDMEQYKSAAVAYKSLIEQFPLSDKLDFYQFMIIKSYYDYAKKSVKDKQEERYASALSAFNELKEYHPKSNYVQQAGVYVASAKQQINQLRNEHK
jgi:outer membrane protein assembly factor BamD